MIDKIVKEFGIALEKEQPYIGFEDRRQIALTLKSLLQKRLLDVTVEHYIDKHWYDQSDEEGKRKLGGYSKESNIIRLVSSLAGNNCLEEKIEKNKKVYSMKNKVYDLIVKFEEKELTIDTIYAKDFEEAKELLSNRYMGKFVVRDRSDKEKEVVLL